MCLKRIDYTNQRFGKLTALRRGEDIVSPKGYHSTTWICRCDCGKEITVRTDCLKRGTTTSCGCYLNEIRGKSSIKTNHYSDMGEYVIGYTGNNIQFKIDKEDFDRVKELCWNYNGKGYIVSRERNGRESKTILLHRYVMGVHNESRRIVVDHINHDTLDNRKQNLRVCTQRENSMNVSLPKNNTSGVRGVRWDSEKRKWHAYIYQNKKSKFLGYFDNFDDAVKARKDAEELWFGEYGFDSNDKFILALDVGTKETGYCIVSERTLKPLEFGIVANDAVYERINRLLKYHGEHKLAIEQFASYGPSNPIGATTIEAITWNGKYIREAELKGIPYEYVYRKEEKMLIVGNMKCGDTEIRRALIKRFANTKTGKGTKNFPDYFYKFSDDMWSAYSVALVCIMRKKEVHTYNEWLEYDVRRVLNDNKNLWDLTPLEIISKRYTPEEWSNAVEKVKLQEQ